LVTLFRFFKAPKQAVEPIPHKQAVEPTPPVIQLVPAPLSSTVKRPEPEAYHPPAVGDVVNDPWSYTSTVPYPFMSWYLIKFRDNLTFATQPAVSKLCIACRRNVVFDFSLYLSGAIEETLHLHVLLSLINVSCGAVG
jgi:hypothetical protein